MAMPSVLVDRDAERIVTWIEPGTPIAYPLGRANGRLRPFEEWDVELRTWKGPGRLELTPFGRRHSIRLFRGDDGTFRGWYVNLQAPLGGFTVRRRHDGLAARPLDRGERRRALEGRRRPRQGRRAGDHDDRGGTARARGGASSTRRVALPDRLGGLAAGQASRPRSRSPRTGMWSRKKPGGSSLVVGTRWSFRGKDAGSPRTAAGEAYVGDRGRRLGAIQRVMDGTVDDSPGQRRRHLRAPDLARPRLAGARVVRRRRRGGRARALRADRLRGAVLGHPHSMRRVDAETEPVQGAPPLARAAGRRVFDVADLGRELDDSRVVRELRAAAASSVTGRLRLRRPGTRPRRASRRNA